MGTRTRNRRSVPASRGWWFRSALADELLPQILAYTEWPIYAFDGPHYLHTQLVSDLLARGVGQD